MKSVQGALSAVPGIASAVDAVADVLRISSAIKPEVYVFAFVWVLYVFLAEPSRYIQTVASSPEFKKMPRRAAAHFVLFFVAAGLYWVGITYAEGHVPNTEWLARLVVVVLAITASAACGEITRAFAINGLRIYIVTHRP